MKTKIIVLTSIVAAGLALSACPGRFGSHDPSRRIEWMAKKISKELSLRPDQDAELQALVTDVKAHVTERHAKMQQRMSAGREALQRDPLDIDAIAALAKSAVRERESAEAMDAFIDRVASLAKTLDAAQQQKLREALLDHLPMD